MQGLENTLDVSLYLSWLQLFRKLFHHLACHCLSRCKNSRCELCLISFKVPDTCKQMLSMLNFYRGFISLISEVKRNVRPGSIRSDLFNFASLRVFCSKFVYFHDRKSLLEWNNCSQEKRLKSLILQGMVFAVGIDSGIIKLYDIRSYEKGPFATFLVSDWKHIMVSWLEFIRYESVPSYKKLQKTFGKSHFPVYSF